MAVTENSKTLLIDYHSFGSITYYQTLVKYNKLKFEQYVHFKKGSCSNRYYVAGPNGSILLSIPLLHTGRERTPFRDLKICNRDKWQVLHWRTLTSAYRRSPWFEFYEDSILPLYERKFEYLTEWNMQAFELVKEWLGISWEISFTEEYVKEYAGKEIIDARNSFSSRHPGEEEAPRYHQVFEDRTGFLPGLSILDMAFCEGKKALSLLD